MWQTIQYVGTPLTLIAFIIAVVAHIYRIRASRLKRIVESVPEADRADVVEIALRDFTVVDTTTLTAKQKHDLALRSLEQRERKYKALLVASVVSFLILAGTVIAITAFAQMGQTDQQPPLVTAYDEIVVFNRLSIKKPEDWYARS